MSNRKTAGGGGNLGQLLILGFDGTELSGELRSLLTRIQPAGVILFARNISDAAQTWRLLRDCRKCVATPLFTCVDLEGGSVDRFRDLLGATPSAADVFDAGDRKLFRRHGQLIAENCRALGFNVDFAPVLDLAREASRSVLRSRAVSDNPGAVAAYARQFLAGLRAGRVLGCGKHFPGLGEGRLDSHRELPVIEKSLRRMWTEDLLPYRRLRGQLPMVMVSHAAYPLVTKDETPASLSKVWMSGILRQRIGYRSLIASDDLEMGAVLSQWPVAESAVAHIRAGGDLCLICHGTKFAEEAYEALQRVAGEDRKFAKRAQDSVRRVQSFKKKSAATLRGKPAPTNEAVAKMTRKMWEFGERVRLGTLATGDGGQPA
jgi:beta-N-acetylhexosaminidase